MKSSKRITALILCFMLAAGQLFFLASCTFFLRDQVEFTKDKLTISLSETVDLDKYIKTYDFYELISLDDSVVVVTSATTIKAISLGSATVRVKILKGDFDDIIISVEYAQPNSLNLECVGELFQTLPQTSPVTLSATLNAGVDSNQAFEWWINDNKQETTAPSISLESQTIPTEIKVEVYLGELYDSKTLRVYEPFSSKLSYEDKIIEVNEPISFSVLTNDFDQNSNPPLFYKWLVDSIAINDNELDEFIFTPSKAGVYNIQAEVNGEMIGGYDLIVRGVVKPEGCSLDYISDYPVIWLKWGNRQDILLNITLTNRITKQPITLDPVNALEGKLDVSDYLNVTSSYDIKITTLSDDNGIYYGGESVQFMHVQVSENALPYLAKRVVAGSCYITRDEQFFDFFEYLMVFRPNSIATEYGYSYSTITLFMGFTSSYYAHEISYGFLSRVQFAGKYNWSISGSLKFNTLATITLNYSCTNNPQEYATEMTKDELLLMPDFSQGYDAPLPIEDRPLSPTRIAYSEQLHYAVQMGFKPDLVEDSVAEQIYLMAYDYLLTILDENMTQIEIAAAIYDLVNYLVTYDYGYYQQESLEESTNHVMYYLEGVFLSGYAVCDGIAKAYSLLCNMAGIDTVRIIGNVVSGSHAWNKLFIEGEGWYALDATWGIGTRNIGTKAFKSGTKGWFMLTEDELGLRAETAGDFIPLSANPFNWFYKNNRYIHDTNNIDSVIEQIAGEVKNNRYNKTLYLGETEVEFAYYAVEYQFAPSLSNKILTPLLQQKLSAEGIGSARISYGSRDTLIIAI